MTDPTPTKLSEILEQILDSHAEYYIRQTMKFFSENGESPALSKNNEGDLKAKTAILKLISTGMDSVIGEAVVTKLDDRLWEDGYNQAIDDMRARKEAWLKEME